MQPSEDEAAEPEAALQKALFSSAIAPLVKRIEGAIQTLVDHDKLNKLTHLPRWDNARQYARLRYLQRVKDSLRDSETWDDFQFPNMETGLIEQDLELKDSYKQGTRKIIESMSKIFERSDGGGRGILGRRKG